MVEWSITTDCKSVGFGLRGFESLPTHIAKVKTLDSIQSFFFFIQTMVVLCFPRVQRVSSKEIIKVLEWCKFGNAVIIMNNKRIWGAIGVAGTVIVGALVFFVFYWNSDVSPESMTEQVSQDAKPGDMVTYKNERYGFELRHAKDVQLSAVDVCGGVDPNGPESCSGVDITINNNPQLIHVDIFYNSNDQTFDEFVRHITRDSQVQDIVRNSINGKEAKSMTIKGAIQLDFIQELIEKETRLGFVNLGNDRVAYFRYGVDGLQERSLYEEILATLTFPVVETSDMRMYRNERLGFEMKIPEKVEGGSVKEIENGNIVWIATEERANEADGGRLKSSLSEYKKVQNLPWAILVQTVETDQELDAFIKNRYGKECGLGEKLPSTQAGVFNVSVDIGESEAGEGCFLNWVFYIKYSPELHKVAVWDVGQEGAFWSVDRTNDYDGRMVKSFRFIDK